MIINSNLSTLTIQLNLEEEEVVLKVYTGTAKIYKAVTSAYSQLQRLEDRKKRLSSNSLSSIDRALETCKLMEEEAEISLWAIKMALVPDEWAKLENIADLLPVSTISQILVAIADGMSKTFLDNYSEGKI